ncbi:hypothetical protein NKDENANG_03053 [Candidatus Entotheonellaceae bacterium PAL068K]
MGLSSEGFPVGTPTIVDSYATGTVSDASGDRDVVGGLVGWLDDGTITNSYATGTASDASGDQDRVGGLVGLRSDGTIADSYWDTNTSGLLVGVGEGSSDGVTGHRTFDLQGTASNTGIYENWNADEEGFPWHFGNTMQYPVLQADFDNDGTRDWPEFGFQLREVPVLNRGVTFGDDQVTFSWRDVDTTSWDPEPEVTYTVYRQEDRRLVALETGLSDTQYTDSAATRLTTDVYQVVAVVNGGEASRSHPLAVCDFPIANAPASLVIRVIRGTDPISAVLRGRIFLYDSTTRTDLFGFIGASTNTVEPTERVEYRDSRITLIDEDDVPLQTFTGVNSLIVFGDDGSLMTFDGESPNQILGGGSLYDHGFLDDESLLSQSSDLDSQVASAMTWNDGRDNCPDS